MMFEAYCLAPTATLHRCQTRIERRLNAAAPALSITIKSLFCRFNPEAEKFAAAVRSYRPSIW